MQKDSVAASQAPSFIINYQLYIEPRLASLAPY